MDLEHKAIARLQEAAKLSEFYYQKPLLLAYSGGKDSEVCLELCRRAGVPFEVIHNLTTADAPETVHHVRKVFRKLDLEDVKCEILHPLYKGHLTSMWALIIKEMYPPIRKVRYCCRYLKERTISRRCAVLGVRRSESSSRAVSGVAEKRGASKAGRQIYDFDNGDERIIAPCHMKANIKIHPIVDWTDRDAYPVSEQAKALANQFSGFQPFLGSNLFGGQRLNPFPDQQGNFFSVLPPHYGSQVFKNFRSIGNLFRMERRKLGFNVRLQVRFRKVFTCHLLFLHLSR